MMPVAETHVSSDSARGCIRVTSPSGDTPTRKYPFWGEPAHLLSIGDKKFYRRLREATGMYIMGEPRADWRNAGISVESMGKGA